MFSSVRTRSVNAKPPAVIRLVVSHFGAVVAEWAAVTGVLVHVFDRSGTRATALASVGLLVAGLFVAPFAGVLVDRHRPQRVRLVGLVIQSTGYGLAATAAFADWPSVVTVLAAMVSLGAVTTLRPSGAVLVPAHVRSSKELVVANLWLWYAESASVLGGPLLATLLLALSGPPAVLVGCAVAALIGAVLTLFDMGVDPPASASADRASGGSTRRLMVSTLRSLRGRPGLSSLLFVVSAQYMLIGALDVLLVVLARTELDLGDAGPGVLSTAFGVGALISIVVATFVVRRTRLAPAIAVALAAAGVSLVVFGLAISIVVALVVLPLLGLSRSLLDGPSRLLLQRSAGPEALGSVFAIREVCASAGLIAGSVFALVTLEIGDAGDALVWLGALFVVVLLATLRGLRLADAGADVPVVEMSLLRRLPMFAPLPSMALEAVARSATVQTVERGTVIVAQGDHGDLFYAVIDGTFDVEMSGQRIRTAERLGFFGEVALLADVPRTATVTASSNGTLLAIEREAFLTAVTGTDSSRQTAWGVVRSLSLEHPVVPNEAMLAAAGGEMEIYERYEPSDPTP